MTFRTVVSVSELAAHVHDAQWRIFDCRHDLADPDAGSRAYRNAHIPNAQFLHLDHDLSGVKTGKNGRHPLPVPETFADTLARRGVSNETQVVAYDDSQGMFAARLWWMLRWLGHADVAVLDGGLSSWKEAGLALTNDIPTISPASFRWRVATKPVDADYVQAHLHQPETILIDARTAERFRGDSEPIDPVAGHIPGAVNRPYRNNLAADGRFKSAPQLREEFDALLGRHAMEDVISYCGSGVAACHHVLALEIAGRHGARLYAGSWSEWCSDTERPTASVKYSGAPISRAP
jgi:thiosulfate/3-mercaptopyruvate sulfurtransferase